MKNDPPKTARDWGDSTAHRWSLATRLTVWYAGLALALTFAATMVLYYFLESSLDQEDDQLLADRVRTQRLELANGPFDPEQLRQIMETEAGGETGRIHLRLLDPRGRWSLETRGMGTLLPVAAFPAPVPVSAEPGKGVNNSAGEATFRVVAAETGIGPAGESTAIIHAAMDRTHEEGLLAEYRLRLWLVLGTAAVLCAVGGYIIAWRGLRPIAEITAATGRIRSTTLHERLERRHLPRELFALAATFNEMLDRLEDSFDRLSRFSSDIAHELRTPVNNLRGQVEMVLGRPRSPEEYREAMASALEECGRLSGMIDALLFLARAENPKMQISRRRLDAREELAGVLEFFEAAATEAGVALKLDVAHRLCLDADRGLFQRALANVIDNALEHTPAGGSVFVSAERRDDGVVVRVLDTGCGIPEQSLPHIVDRLYRVDRARAAHGSGDAPGRRGRADHHAGLGLTIVKTILDLHGGSLAIRSEEGKGTCVELHFPYAPSDDAAALTSSPSRAAT